MPILIIFLLAFSSLHAQHATFYKDWYEGRTCSNGDIFRQAKFTCASNDYPKGTILRVSYLNKWIDVRVNDRLKRGTTQIIDLSKSAFMMLADTSKGKIKVKIKVIKL